MNAVEAHADSNMPSVYVFATSYSDVGKAQGADVLSIVTQLDIGNISGVVTQSHLELVFYDLS